MDCEVDTCSSNGVCKERLGGGFLCICDNGWKGVHCDENIDDCRQNQCAHGAECVDTLADFECICMAGWTGKTCNQGL